jgi:hypothetical protein
MPMPFKGDSEFNVYCGDTSFYFEKGRSYRWSYLRQVFNERIKLCPACSHPYELFPGAIFTDPTGELWEVQLQAVLIPARSPREIHKPEETNEPICTNRKQNEVPKMRRNRKTLKE